MLIIDVDGGAWMGTSTFQYSCFRKFKNSIILDFPAHGAARRMISLDRMVQLPYPMYQTMCLHEHNRYNTTKTAYLPFNHQK